MSRQSVLLILLAPLVVVVLLIELQLVEYAYQKIGIGPRHLFTLLALSFLGSYVNVPLGRLGDEEIASVHEVSAFGIRHRVPVVERKRGTLVAINLGGAILPAAISGWLLVSGGSLLGPLLTTVVVTLVVHALARPVRGLGIAVPMWSPPLVAAAAALLLAPAAPARAAYVGGTLGSLLGADLLNLGRLRGLGAPVASIGGAGTFDGIFLTGVLAALLA